LAHDKQAILRKSSTASKQSTGNRIGPHPLCMRLRPHPHPHASGSPARMHPEFRKCAQDASWAFMTRRGSPTLIGVRPSFTAQRQTGDGPHQPPLPSLACCPPRLPVLALIVDTGDGQKGDGTRSQPLVGVGDLRQCIPCYGVGSFSGHATRSFCTPHATSHLWRWQI
jgi:hypothetical protein